MTRQVDHAGEAPSLTHTHTNSTHLETGQQRARPLGHARSLSRTLDTKLQAVGRHINAHRRAAVGAGNRDGVKKKRPAKLEPADTVR